MTGYQVACNSFVIVVVIGIGGMGRDDGAKVEQTDEQRAERRKGDDAPLLLGDAYRKG